MYAQIPVMVSWVPNLSDHGYIFHLSTKGRNAILLYMMPTSVHKAHNLVHHKKLEAVVVVSWTCNCIPMDVFVEFT